MAEVFSLHKFEVQQSGESLLDSLVQHVAGLSKSKARTAILAGLVSIDGEVDSDVHSILPMHSVTVQLDLRHGLAAPLDQQIAQRPFKILYIDRDIVVVDKAAGILASQPRRLEDTKTKESHLSDLIGRTLKKIGKEVHYVGYVHRLDQETSGAICLALTKDAHRHLADQFATKEANRIYRCIVTGHPVQDQDTLRGLIVRGIDGRRRLVHEELPGEHGEKAVTEFKVLERFEGGADCEVRLLTGRTHQVRVSMAAIGAPVFGDELYGEKRKSAPRMMLHAWKLTLTHPKTGEEMTFEAPLPQVFKDCRPPKINRSQRRSQNTEAFESREEPEEKPFQAQSNPKTGKGADRTGRQTHKNATQRSHNPKREVGIGDSETPVSTNVKTPWKTNPKRIDTPRDSVQYSKKAKPSDANYPKRPYRKNPTES